MERGYQKIGRNLLFALAGLVTVWSCSFDLPTSTADQRNIGALLVSAGGYHGSLVKNGGAFWVFGSDWQYQCGNINTSGTEVPKAAIVFSSGVASSSSGFEHTLVVLGDGFVLSAGLNDQGQCGFSYRERVDSFTAINLSDVVRASAGYKHSLFLKKDGTVWGVGSNSKGQLGFADPKAISEPRMISGGAKAIEAAEDCSFIIMADGSLWATGLNSGGKLGTGDARGNDLANFTKVIPSGVVSVDSGMDHTLVLKDDGSVWAFGSNSSGQLGTGNRVSSNTPVKVVDRGIVAISAGGYHSLLLGADGSVWGMGKNDKHQLGVNVGTESLIPVVLTDRQCQGISAGREFSLLISFGTVYSAGSDWYGQLARVSQAEDFTPIDYY